MIESLTPEQEATFPHYVSKWLKVGLSTDPINVEESKKYVKMAYEVAGLTCPDEFHVVSSPNESVKLDSKLFGCTEKESLDATCYGNHEASWLSFYDFFWEQCGIEDCKKLEGLMGIAKNCGWWVPREKYVILQDRPSEIHMVEERLHNDKGMAVKYRDGWGIWSINGFSVTEQIVMRPETMTVEQIDAEQNQDIRSIMLDRFTWVRYIKDTNAQCINHRDNPVEGTKEALYRLKEDNRLIVTCPTGRLFCLGVPSNVETCEEAQRWLGGNRSFNVIART
jgi:hypothetical protein